MLATEAAGFGVGLASGARATGFGPELGVVDGVDEATSDAMSVGRATGAGGGVTGAATEASTFGVAGARTGAVGSMIVPSGRTATALTRLGSANSELATGGGSGG